MAVITGAPVWTPKQDEAARRITVMWVATAGILFTLFALAGLLMRLTQATGVLPDQWFYAILTLHGAGMVATTLMALAALMWFVVRDQLPVSTRVNQLNYGMTAIAVVLVFVSTVFGRFGPGWTFLYPLPSHPGPFPGWDPGWAYPYYVAIALVALAFALWGADILRAGIVRFGNPGRMFGIDILTGQTKPEDPNATTPTILAAGVMAIEGVLTAIPGTVIIVLLIIHSADLTFDVPALFAKNLIYFVGHMLANFDIYLGAGLVYAILPIYAKRPWHASKSTVIAWLAIIITIIFPYFHHLYMDFAEPTGLAVVGQVASYASALPSAVVTIFGGVLIIYHSGIKWSPAPLFLFAGLAGWTIGGVGALIDSTPVVNTYMHNTLWVPAHFHTYMALGAVLFLLGAVYHLTPALTQKTPNELIGRAGSALILSGGWVVVLTFFASGAMSIPRRYAYVDIPRFENAAAVGLAGACLAAIGILLIAADMLRIYVPAMRPPSPPAVRRVTDEPPPVSAEPAV